MQIITIGHALPIWLDEGSHYYQKLLRSKLSLNIQKIAPASPKLDIKQRRKKDQTALMKHIKNNSFLIALDETGTSLSSIDFATTLNKWQEIGKNIVFVIGPSDGFDIAFKASADFVLSMSHMTFTHDMTLVLLLEQLYRATSIANNHPYHRA